MTRWRGDDALQGGALLGCHLARHHLTGRGHGIEKLGVNEGTLAERQNGEYRMLDTEFRISF